MTGQKYMHEKQPSILESVFPFVIIFIGLWKLLLPSCSSAVEPIQTYTDIKAYILKKIEHNDIIFLGETHKNSNLIETTADLLPYLHDAGVTHIAFEISSDQQGVIDNYMETGEGLNNIKIHPQIACPEFRNLFSALRSIDIVRRPILIAIDLPISEYQGAICRDEYMARSLTNIIESHPNARIFVILGNNHVLKKLEWEDSVINPHKSIREYLNESPPDTTVFSICQITGRTSNQCDFWERLHSDDGPTALDINRNFQGWEIGFIQNLAIKPVDVSELVDGLIIY
jgi:hypothetical protein